MLAQSSISEREKEKEKEKEKEEKKHFTCIRCGCY